MPAPANLIHETSASTGTGNLTVAAVNGRVRFSDGTYGFGTGGTNVFDSFISNRDAAEWEIGTSHMSDANTFVRDTVIFSSNGNAPVSFSAGTKDITNDVPAGYQVRNEGSTVTDGHAVVFDGATGRLIESAGGAPYLVGGTDVSLADGGTGSSLSDPNADRILFWDDSAGAVAWLAPTNGLELSGTSLQMGDNQRAVAIPFIIDGGGSTITTGVKGDLEIPINCTITGWTLLLDQSGSIVIDIWKDTYANYPPVAGDSITASDKPTVSAATKGQDLAPTGWTTTVTAGDTLRFNVDSITTATRATLVLRATRT